ncbi:serine hydrolase [Gimesia fumaroli]|uniref:Penicillin-binding protein 4 n=1 Tax=Gimesia fumaroli TaxID=2527976 RepID=A0A518IA24_9PLAN|nr:serine hydrolase [Gimesia fumaroli]QDV49910.1 Penicillin-binding protein 4* [Gimesia fumaroli]
MHYLRPFLFALLFMTLPLNAAETEFELQLTSSSYQRFITRIKKQGFALTDVSVTPGKRFDRFMAIAVKRPDQKAWKAHHGLDARQLEEKQKQYASEGFQPVVISGYERGNTSRFAVSWEKNEQAEHIIRHSLSNTQLQDTLNELKQKGFIPFKLDGYMLNNQPVHAGIWVKRNDVTWDATCNVPSDQFQKIFEDVSSQGFRLIDLCGYVIDRNPVYHAVWYKETEPAWMSQFHLTLKQFQAEDKKMQDQNYQLTNIDGYRINNQPFFNAIWVKEENKTESSIWKNADEIPVSGKEQKEFASLDRSVKEFLLEHQPPGAAVAVSYQGRLVYARGFGYADQEQKKLVQPNSQFRIASISKPITAVAIMKLVEEDQLELNTRVFDILKSYQNELSQQGVDPRLKEVTIQQLLNHTGGWDRSASFDPMFRSVSFAKQLGTKPPAETEDVIQVMLKQPLDFKPGERFAYSNFGYCLLGRVIETVAGKPYHEYIQQEICDPLQMTQTKLGKTLLKYREPNEVKYYSPRVGTSVFSEEGVEQVPQPYGAWYLEAMDSHGGWISSAPDLVRFATAFNNREQCPILKAPTISQMFQRPEGLAGFDQNGDPKSFYYACGWSVRPFNLRGSENHWHNGALPGTSTILVRRRDGINWAILFNTRYGKEKKSLSSLIDGQMHRWVNQINDWPEYDLIK